MTVRIPDLTLTATERRTLLRLVDDKWEDINRMRPRDGTYLDQSDVLYLQTLEAIQQKLKS